ncbi:Dolichyl-phosphate-mannose--protein mannosyltransferase 4 [Umbelopsis sp. WA50703]
MSDAAVRKRNAGSTPSKKPAIVDDKEDVKKASLQAASIKGVSLDNPRDRLSLIAITGLAFALRLIMISYPAEVVFDEVHFGKFLGFYLNRSYFFDVHPPLAKLTLAAAGKLIGYDGHFDFGNINDSYTENNVPHVLLRAVPATFGALCAPLLYLTMRHSGYSFTTCIFTCAMYLFDNSHVAQTRLILLDSQLVFYMLCTVYSYVRFYKARHQEFSRTWYTWLIATGVSMALTLSVKMVGLFLVAAIGFAVVLDLWGMMDFKRGLELNHIMKHFYARAFALIFVPACVYLFWFWVHFSILDTSGPGDAFMTARFQSTLKGNPLTAMATTIYYNDNITIQHRDTGNYLFSWNKTYPLRYDDGRISSQGHQVSANDDTEDSGNVWQVLRTGQNAEDDQLTPVQHGDIVQLRHIETDRLLMTHDVASPLISTNTEFTTVDDSQVETHYQNTLFELQFDELDLGTKWQTHVITFQLIHVDTRVSMYSRSKKWPEWAGYKHDVNGNKKMMDRGNRWIVNEVIGRTAEDEAKEEKEIEKMPFLFKFVELQLKMLSENNKLTGEHPYMSSPITWLIPNKGISYWHNTETKGQIYMTGNIVGWCLGIASIAVYCGIALADLVARRRGFDLLDEPVRRRFLRSGGFLSLVYALHYFPFWLMGRALFLHHYLPAVTVLYMVLGVVFEFMFVDGITTPASDLVRNESERVNHRPRVVNPVTTMAVTVTTTANVVAAVIVGAQLAFFIWMIPLTYGAPGMDVKQVVMHQILGWELQFAK